MVKVVDKCRFPERVPHGANAPLSSFRAEAEFGERALHLAEDLLGPEQLEDSGFCQPK
ncbi:hypothetical protein GCM10009637_14680 [Brevibacterium luteolum]